MNLFARWGTYVTEHVRGVLTSSIAVVVLGLGLTPFFVGNLLGVGYDTPGTESATATARLAELTGYTERATLVLSSESLDADDPAFVRALEDVTEAVHEVDPGILVAPPGSPGGGAVADDGRALTATIGFTGPAADRQSQSHDIQERIDEVLPAEITGGLTGNSPVLADLLHVEHTDMIKAELVGLPLALVVLVVALGSVVAAALPLLLGLGALLVAFGVIAVVMLVMDFNVFTESIIAMVGLGVGIDYALLIVRRYREELGRLGDAGQAVVRTLETAGRTVAFSGAILCTSLVPLAVTDLPFFGEAALGTVVVVAADVLLSITLLPALLLVLGDRIDRWPVPRRLRRDPARAGGGWDRWARAVMRRPIPVLVAGVAVMLALALPALDLRTGIDLNARAMENQESVKALTDLEDHFPAAALAPVEILVPGGDPGPVAALVRADDRLASVVVQPLDDGASAIFATPTPEIGVDTDEAARLVDDLRADLADAVPDEAARPLVTGVTAETVDYSDETNTVTPWVVGLALLLSFVLLLWIFRSPLLAAKAIVMNLLSIGASFGLVVLFFQHGLGEEIFDFTGTGYIQTWMPLTLFMLLFGLSMDYEVFMVSRMREEWERTGDTTEAVATGLERTGGVVTSAAAIMVAIFASFILTSIPEMKQMGFGLAVAVLLDATIVRAALVPAFMQVAGRWNWWMPRALDRALPTLRH